MIKYPRNIHKVRKSHGWFLYSIGITVLITMFPWISGCSQDFNHVYISEIMADNFSTQADEDGAYSDWIELYNPTSEAIDLDGWYLSDNPDNLIKWIFPQVTIEADGFLVVFASGKDRHINELHTNFKLSSSGEWIILTRPDGKTIQYEVNFPPQYVDISYGYFNGEIMHFDHPTPGGSNVAGDFLSAPLFSGDHGFYDAPFTLEMISNDSGGSIVYTLDGSTPDLSNGIVYSQGITIDTTRVVRSRVVKEGALSPIATSTFIFADKVKNQSSLPEGYPSNWGSFSSISGNAPADYGMDPDICNATTYKAEIVPALKDIPTISLVTDKGNFFSLSTDPVTGGIYIHTDPPTGGLGEDWERPVSAEYILADGSHGFQMDCGIRTQGGHSRVPEKNPKHSFRLVFRGEYGAKKLNYDLFGESATSSFNSIVLRAGFNQTWLHWDDGQREKAQYITDSWAKDTYMKMGHIAAHNKFVHLYINGLYWGLYNLCERMDDDFMDYYLDGDSEDFDVIKDYAEVAEGNSDAWDAMMEMAAEGLSDAQSYYGIQGKDEFGSDDPSKEALLDVENLIDYMILNFYAGNKDWDHHNWVAARNRIDPAKGFQFFPWDSERTFNGKNDNVVEEYNENRPSFLYSQLRHNPVFRNKFKQRANELLGPGGILSPDSAMALWSERSKEIELAIITESARWGDYRRDIHPYKSEPFELYTKNDHWQQEQERLKNEYFPVRSQIVLDQLAEIGLAGDFITGLKGETDQAFNNHHKSFPNPFDNNITIQYRAPHGEIVMIEVFTKEGQLIEQLYRGLADSELVEVNWKPGKLNQGIYFYRITSNKGVKTGKMVYMK